MKNIHIVIAAAFILISAGSFMSAREFLFSIRRFDELTRRISALETQLAELRAHRIISALPEEQPVRVSIP